MAKLSLSREECKVLYQKYIKIGLSPIQANDRIKRTKKHLRNVVFTLKAQSKSENEINLRFQEEWEKICQEVEAEILEITERR